MYLITLGLLFAGLFSVNEAKCSLSVDDAGDRSITYVCLHGDVKDLDDVPNEAEWIEFTVMRFDVINSATFARFTELRKLTFFNCKIGELKADAFRDLDQLEMLVMFNTKLAVARARLFRNIRNLKILKLEGTGLMYIEPEVFEILSERLEEFSIRNNDLDCLPVESLSKIERLKVMQIDHNPWLCECKHDMLNFFREADIQQISNKNFDNRSKRDYASQSSEQWYRTTSNHHVHDCMVDLKYPPLPPINVTTDTEYYNRFHIELREQKITSVHNLDHLPDNIGWLEIFDVHIPRLQQYMFFRFGNTLRSITLRNCGIQSIETDAFAGLHKVERLVIVGAKLPVIGRSWFRDLGKLTELVLERVNIEEFEYGALDHLTSLRTLDLKGNNLNCLSDDAIHGVGKLERLDVKSNPWLCSCRQDLEDNLFRRRIGYEISNSENNGMGCLQEADVTHPTKYDESYYSNTSNGWIRWSWGYESHQSRPRPPPPRRPPTPLIIAPPPIHHNRCRPVPAGDHFDSHYYNHLRGHTYLCEGASLTDVRQVPSITETIIFTKSLIEILRPDEFRKFDGFLKRLEFRDCSIQEIETGAFAGIRNLEALTLRGNNVKVIRSEWFTDTPNLHHLNLAHNNIHEIENMVFDRLPFLVSLDLSDNKINCISTEKLQSLRYIREVHLTGNPWTCLCAEALYRYVHSRNVFCANACLDVVLRDRCHNTALTFRPTTTPAPSPPPQVTTAYPKPPVVDSRGNITGSCYSENNGKNYHCSDGDRFTLDQIPSWVSSIELHDCYIEYLPASTFSRFENLTELALRNCSLKEIDERAFLGLRRLERLTIKGNNVAVVREGWFNHLENLYHLDLSQNYLTEIEAQAFRNLKYLQYLNLEDNMFSCIYTNFFIQLPQLDTVEFSRNPLKWRCWQDLKQFLEVRAIAYTDHKCPYDAINLVRSLQSSGSSEAQNYAAGSSALGVTYFGLVLALVVLYSIG